MRRLLLLLLGTIGTTAIARVFRESPAYRGQQQFLVSPANYGRRILRSPHEPRTYRSRVFRNVVVNANGNSTILLTGDTNISSILDEPRLRSQGRFYKRAQAVPIHDVSQHPGKETIQIAAYSYDEEKHHDKKLVEDSMTMVEANDFARGLERTTVSVKREEATTPIPTTAPTTTTHLPPARPEFQQPPAAFAQPAAIRQVPGSRTFSQTVQAGGLGQPIQPPLAPQPPLIPQLPQQPQPPILPGRPPVLPQPFQPPPFPNGLVPAIPGTPALAAPIGIATDALQIASGIPQIPQVPPQPGQPPLLGQGPAGGVPPPPALPNLSQPNPSQPPLPGSGTNGHPPPTPVQPVMPPRDRFEVVNQQSANSSLEQLGCGFDWLTNSCKDVFNIGWCGRCHDFGNIFLHDCKCIQPLVQLPPRPPPPRPAFLRLL